MSGWKDEISDELNKWGDAVKDAFGSSTKSSGGRWLCCSCDDYNSDDVDQCPCGHRRCGNCESIENN